MLVLAVEQQQTFNESITLIQLLSIAAELLGGAHALSIADRHASTTGSSMC